MKKLFCLYSSQALPWVSLKSGRSTGRGGGADLQNVNDRAICVDGFKVFQTIVFAFDERGGSAVSDTQLMEEKNGILVPVRCAD